MAAHVSRGAEPCKPPHRAMEALDLRLRIGSPAGPPSPAAAGLLSFALTFVDASLLPVEMSR